MKISFVSPTFNEQDNIEVFINSLMKAIGEFSDFKFRYEIIIIDNASEDNTVNIIKNLIKKYNCLKLIVNKRNFGHIISPYYGIMQANGDAVVYLASDLQDPPELIDDLLRMWKSGSEVVYARKKTSDESILFFYLRKLFYFTLSKVVSYEYPKNCTGFGIYDNKVIEQLRLINDPYPFLRGLIPELGFKIDFVDFIQPVRKNGKSKNNIFTLYDILILAFIKSSNILIRSVIFFGLFFLSISVIYNLYVIFNFGKVNFEGIVFIFLSIITVFLGFLGEYLAVILRHVDKKPILLEKYRINFKKDD